MAEIWRKRSCGYTVECIRWHRRHTRCLNMKTRKVSLKGEDIYIRYLYSTKVTLREVYREKEELYSGFMEKAYD